MDPDFSATLHIFRTPSVQTLKTLVLYLVNTQKEGRQNIFKMIFQLSNILLKMDLHNSVRVCMTWKI